jgi:hypothetical protein
MGYVEITATDHSSLIKTSTRDFEETCDLVAEAHRRYVAGTLAKTMHDNILKSEAMNYVPGGICFDARLRGVVDFYEAVTVDWVHTYLQEGVVNVEALRMIQAFSPDTTPGDLVTFLQKPWQFPHVLEGKGKQLWRIFTEHRLDDHGDVDKVRASASELLGVYSLLRHYFATEVVDDDGNRARRQPYRESFAASCNLVDLLLDAKRVHFSPRRAVRTLRDAIGRFMRLHLACHGSDYVRPKHAWQWAIAEHWLRDDAVWDALIIERLHLVVKSTAYRLRGHHRMERTILSGTLNAQVAALQTLKGPCCLLDEPVQVDALPDTFFADSMQVWGMSLHVGDVVFHGDAAGKLLSCVLEHDALYGIVDMFIQTAVLTPHAKRWRCGAADIQLILAGELDQARSWIVVDDDHLDVLRR